MKKLVLVLLVGLIFTSCTWNVDYVKANAEERFEEFGYEIVAYEGFKWSIWGGNVWYQIKKPNDLDDIRYTCYLHKRRSELHLYGPIQVEKAIIVGSEK